MRSGFNPTANRTYVARYTIKITPSQSLLYSVSRIKLAYTTHIIADAHLAKLCILRYVLSASYLNIFQHAV
jgi:hypothetical protein